MWERKIVPNSRDNNLVSHLFSFEKLSLLHAMMGRSGTPFLWSLGMECHRNMEV